MNYSNVFVALTFPPGETFQTYTVPVVDDGVITPDLTLTNYLINVSSPALSGDQPTASLTIQNVESTVNLSAPTYSRNEDAIDGVATIHVIRSGGLIEPASVNFTTTVGSAVPFTNYIPVTTNLVFNPGDSDLLVKIPLIHDFVVTGNLTVGMVLYFPLNTTLGPTNSALLTINDVDHAPGQLQFASGQFGANENDGNAVLTVTRTNGSSGSVNVNYTTVAGGTAVSGNDYIFTEGVLAFADGDTSESFTIPVIHDTNSIQDMTVNVILYSPTNGATLGAPTNATLTIFDVDFAPYYLRFASTNFIASETDPAAQITVLRGGKTDNALSVNFAVSNGTAVANSDYLPHQRGVELGGRRWPSKSFYIPLMHDFKGKPSTTVNLYLYNATAVPATNVLVPSPISLLTISNVDTTVKFAATNFSVAENGSNALVTVLRAGLTNGEVLAGYTTVPSGTAIAGLDYTPVSGFLDWTNGDAAPKTISIPIRNNSRINPDKTFGISLTNIVSLSLNTNVYLENPSNAVVTIVNDDTVNPVAGTPDATYGGNLGANGTVYSVAFDNQQRLYAAGNFTAIYGAPQGRITRLDANGSVDAGFATGSGFDQSVYMVMPYTNLGGRRRRFHQFQRPDDSASTGRLAGQRAALARFPDPQRAGCRGAGRGLAPLPILTFSANSFQGTSNQFTNPSRWGPIPASLP